MKIVLRIAKITGLGLVGVVTLVLITAAFVDGAYAVKREVTINQPVDAVFDYVKYLKNQDSFSVWAKMDPNMKKTFQGTDGEVGAIAGWESQNENVGKGEQEIKNVEPGKRIDYELRFIEPFESTDNASITTEAASESQTKVAWAFEGEMAYPMNLMMLFMDMEGMLGKDLQEGLDNLKGLLEK